MDKHTGVTKNKEEKENLEGDIDVTLPPIAGEDTRRKLPSELFERRPLLFLAKFLFAIGIIAASTSVIIFSSNYWLFIPAIIVNGMMFAHLIELQHECMHGHAFRSPALNRLFGVCCGIFMMSSNAHYRYDHLRHHAYLGTNRNLEHFNYRFSNLDSIGGFFLAFFDLSRYNRVIKILSCVLSGKAVPDVNKKKTNKEIKQEYTLYFFLFILSVAASFYWGGIVFATVLFAWWIPALFIAEGVHFLIEMPEHFGLNTMTQPDVLANTRTIRTSRLIRWFVNGNDLHTAHHYHQGVPMCNVEKLHKMIENRIVVVEPSYWSLYKRIWSGDLKQNLGDSCMDH